MADAVTPTTQRNSSAEVEGPTWSKISLGTCGPAGVGWKGMQSQRVAGTLGCSPRESCWEGAGVGAQVQVGERGAFQEDEGHSQRQRSRSFQQKVKVREQRVWKKSAWAKIPEGLKIRSDTP